MIKNTQAQLERVNTNITRIKEFSDKLGEINSTDKEVFWKAIKTIADRTKEGHRESILHKLNENSIEDSGTILGNLKFHAGAISAIDGILELVEKNADNTAEAAARIKELESVRDEIRNNIDLQ